MDTELTGIRWFFESNSTSARLARTVVQGLIAMLIALLTYYADIAPEWVSVLIGPAIMYILSPIMGGIGKTLDKEETPTVGGTD